MTRRIIEFFVLGAIVALSCAVFDMWFSNRTKQRDLQNTIATQEKMISQANVQAAQGEVSLKSTLEKITKLKEQTRSPSQVIDRLPKYLRLPQPLTLEESTVSSNTNYNAFSSRLRSGAVDPENTHEDRSVEAAEFAPASNKTSSASQMVRTSPLKTGALSPDAEIPTADLKPLFDFVQDSSACQAELIAARQNAAASIEKFTAVTHERDAALAAGKGGSVWHRLRRNADWFAVGALAGFLAAHH
jgi:uncharacterized protein YoxC